MRCIRGNGRSWISGWAKRAEGQPGLLARPRNAFASLRKSTRAEELTDSATMRRNVASSGVPRMRKIWFSWSLLSRPRKSGTPEIILRRMSAFVAPSKMQKAGRTLP